MSKLIDISKLRFGRLVAIRKSAYKSSCGNYKWECICDCGGIVFINTSKLRSGHTKSCGCLLKECSSDRMKRIKTTHGLTNHTLFRCWSGIIARCLNCNDENYRSYGGRGISMCEEWKNDFKSFYDWSLENGWKKGLSIDRINNDGNYEPCNCRWTDRKTQQRNKRTNKLITYNGETKCLADWCERLGLNYNTVNERLRVGGKTAKEAFEKNIKS